MPSSALPAGAYSLIVTIGSLDSNTVTVNVSPGCT
jgi:hypothetical protein